MKRDTQVSETTNQVGRFSISTANDMPYMEMAGHCEALSAGKQKKMSALMSQQSVIKVSACDQIQPMQGYEHNQAVEMSTDFHFQQVLYIHLQSVHRLFKHLFFGSLKISESILEIQRYQHHLG